MTSLGTGKRITYHVTSLGLALSLDPVGEHGFQTIGWRFQQIMMHYRL